MTAKNNCNTWQVQPHRSSCTWGRWTPTWNCCDESISLSLRTTSMEACWNHRKFCKFLSNRGTREGKKSRFNHMNLPANWRWKLTLNVFNIFLSSPISLKRSTWSAFWEAKKIRVLCNENVKRSSSEVILSEPKRARKAPKKTVWGLVNYVTSENSCERRKMNRVGHVNKARSLLDLERIIKQKAVE